MPKERLIEERFTRTSRFFTILALSTLIIMGKVTSKFRYRLLAAFLRFIDKNIGLTLFGILAGSIWLKKENSLIPFLVVYVYPAVVNCFKVVIVLLLLHSSIN